ncbi:MAG: GTPase HflX [Dehalococcoidia bacterium]|nr:GTPase HflX [Dehalococcoidia bacterium]MCA9856388.1 GTPase HflX [Dehalococcoidia bacterium]MCB9484008.1 GTPase HflX [Dehalococcoidia bacterium]
MSTEESMRELGRLVRTAGGWVVGSATQRRPHPDPAHYIGSGKLEEITERREELDYSMVVFDDQLSPSQQFNLERMLGVKVLDRSALILDIFASRARTREARLQVELAQHEYLLPRLRGQWQHLERTEGAIGTRGPGETQLETDRRLIGTRIARLKKQIEQVKRQRDLQRSRRQRQGLPTVALVGYTNAGKSSLMRALAGAKVLVADAVFATLDPVTRRIGAGTGEAFLLTDTVGFMQKLPTQLVSAFRATLEELGEADLLLHVVDATASTRDAQIRTVLETLHDLGLDDMPVLTVFNKADGLTLEDGSPVETEEDLAILATEYDPGVSGEVAFTSAVSGLGIDALRERLLYEFFGTLGDDLVFEFDEDGSDEPTPAALGIVEGDPEPAEPLAG